MPLTLPRITFSRRATTRASTAQSASGCAALSLAGSAMRARHPLVTHTHTATIMSSLSFTPWQSRTRSPFSPFSTAQAAKQATRCCQPLSCRRATETRATEKYVRKAGFSPQTQRKLSYHQGRACPTCSLSICGASRLYLCLRVQGLTARPGRSVWQTQTGCMGVGPCHIQHG
jgi:hypothetical protein